MNPRNFRRARLATSAALTLLALAACGPGDDAESSARPDSGQRVEAAAPEGAALAAAAADPPPSADTYITDAANQPWSQAEAYIKLLTFETTAGSAGADDIELCEGCAHSTKVRIQPVRGVQHIGPKNVSDASRIVARVTIDAFDEKTDTRRLRSLGLLKDNKSHVSYLLARKDGTAVFIYERGGKIAFSNYNWSFDASSDGRMLNKPVAEFHELHDDDGDDDRAAAQDTVIVNHTSSIWLACAEGCCNAQTTL